MLDEKLTLLHVLGEEDHCIKVHSRSALKP